MPIIDRLLMDLSYATTIVGLFMILIQMKNSNDQRKIEHEESIEMEYREIIKSLPYKVLIGESISDSEHNKLLENLYRYFDLSNSQVYLRYCGKITKRTWDDWKVGISELLEKQEIRKAFEELIKKNKMIFKELRYFRMSKEKDPIKWNRKEFAEYC